jgi:hypothetical protein
MQNGAGQGSPTAAIARPLGGAFIMFHSKLTEPFFRFISRHTRSAFTPSTVGLQGPRLWLLSLLFLLLGSQAFAGTVNLQWDAVTHPTAGRL